MLTESTTVALIAAIPGIMASIFALYQARKARQSANRSEILKVEAEAYGRAREMYEAGIRQLEKQMESLRLQLSSEQNISKALRDKVNELEETIALMRRQLISAGIDLPPLEEHE